LIFGDYMLVFPDIKGISSSLITTVRLAATAATIGLSGLLFTGSIRPVAILVFVLTYLSLLCLFALRRHEKAEAISELPEEA
jgi:DHA1 family bicyclomycin/chloramphenicol resistance-like MFS transporter